MGFDGSRTESEAGTKDSRLWRADGEVELVEISLAKGFLFFSFTKEARAIQWAF